MTRRTFLRILAASAIVRALTAIAQPLLRADEVIQ
jgi:hypothetical protein